MCARSWQSKEPLQILQQPNATPSFSCSQLRRNSSQRIGAIWQLTVFPTRPFQLYFLTHEWKIDLEGNTKTNSPFDERIDLPSISHDSPMIERKATKDAWKKSNQTSRNSNLQESTNIGQRARPLPHFSAIRGNKHTIQPRFSSMSRDDESSHHHDGRDGAVSVLGELLYLPNNR